MKWLSNLQTLFGHDEPKEVDNKEGVAQATTLLDNARKALDEARQRKVETTKVSSSLVVLNGINHYGESIFLAMMPREKKHR